MMAFSLLLDTRQAKAGIVPPDSGFAEQVIMRASMHDVTVNCDMVGEPSGFIKAIVWSDNPVPGGGGPQAYIYAEDYAYPSGFPYPGPGWTKGNSDVLALPAGSANPDVALAAYEDPVFPHNLKYQVVVTYTIGADLYVEVYDLLNIGNPGFAINTTPTYSEHLSDDCNGFPHIDMWADGGKVPFLPNYWAMHQFAVVFSEGPTAALYGYVNDAVSWVSQPTNAPFPINEPFAPYNQVDTCMKPDVACQYNFSDQFMHIVYEEAEAGTTVGAGLVTLTYDYPNAVVTTGPNLQQPGNIYAPRIEAIGDFSVGNPGTPPYQVAFSWKGGSSGTDEVWGYNPAFGLDPSSQLDLGNPDECMSACVAAGPVSNHWFYPNIGDQQYTVGFYPWGNGGTSSSPPRDLNIYARNISFSNGQHASLFTYRVNTGANNVNYHWDLNRNMAVTNCSNLGNDILAVWYNGTDLVYKHSAPDVMAFKSLELRSAPPQDLGASPNPATDKLYVRNAASGTAYRISDMTGKKVMSGRLADYRIDIASLPAGNYMIHTAAAGNETKAFFFSKQ